MSRLGDLWVVAHWSDPLFHINGHSLDGSTYKSVRRNPSIVFAWRVTSLTATQEWQLPLKEGLLDFLPGGI